MILPLYNVLQHYGVTWDMMIMTTTTMLTVTEWITEWITLMMMVTATGTSLITVCEESKIPVMYVFGCMRTRVHVCMCKGYKHWWRVRNRLFRVPFSKALITEVQIILWIDEIHQQNSKWRKLNEAIQSNLRWSFQPCDGNLMWTCEDISNTRQWYYICKAKETIAA